MGGGMLSGLGYGEGRTMGGLVQEAGWDWPSRHRPSLNPCSRPGWASLGFLDLRY